MGDEMKWHTAPDRTPARVDPMSGPRLGDLTVLAVVATVAAVDRVAGVLRPGARPGGKLHALPVRAQRSTRAA